MLRNFERISNDVYRVANIITIFNTLSAPPPSTISWTTAHLAGLVSVASSLIVYISLKCIKNTQSRIPLLPISDSGVDVVRLPWTPPQHPHPTANIRVLNSLRCQKCCLLSLHSALLPYYETRLSEPGPPLKNPNKTISKLDTRVTFILTFNKMHYYVVVPTAQSLLWNLLQMKKGEVHSKPDKITRVQADQHALMMLAGTDLMNFIHV